MSFVVNHIFQIGLGINFLGSVCLIKSALFMTEEKAIEISSARWGPYDRNFAAVKDKLLQRNWAIAGAALLAIGFILQTL
jgi:hypothetical protein